jgi:hypothetical protein
MTSGRLTITLRVSSPSVGTLLSLVRTPEVGQTLSPRGRSQRMTGQCLQMTGSQPVARGSQRVSSYKTHAELESGKHDVALFLEESILPGEGEEQDESEGLKLKTDLMS